MTGYSLTLCGYIRIRVEVTHMHCTCGAPHPCKLSQHRRSPSVGTHAHPCLALVNCAPPGVTLGLTT
jgi:hypothetical protein